LSEFVPFSEIPAKLRAIGQKVIENLNKDESFAEGIYNELDEKWRSNIESGLEPALKNPSAKRLARNSGKPLFASGAFKEGLSYQVDRTSDGMSIKITNLSPVKAAWHLFGTSRGIPARKPITMEDVKTAFQNAKTKLMEALNGSK
jgi:hypothetical protein